MDRNEPLLLISEDLSIFQKSMESTDLRKAKSDRDGLIQQIVTYVRDGRTVTRKQWVRSEFAEHAKKSEEQKRQSELNEKKRERDKDKHKLEDENAKKRNEDKRAYKKKLTQAEEFKGTKARTKVTELDRKRKQLEKKRKLEDKDKKKKEERKKDNKKKEQKEKEQSRFGQREQTTAQNKAEEKMLHT